jgi:alkanesulfonate monooxygenase SsuD/methylene tetrahydromethanopterin reductase-like flavin-dependent oxidoreductase (luciferase family)
VAWPRFTTAAGHLPPGVIKEDRLMRQQLIGVAVRGDNARAALAMIERAEQVGIDAAWMTTGGARLDNLTLFAAAAVRTQRLKLGTSIVPTFPRHPLVMVQQTQVVAQLAPGRFRLGIGPSHRPSMEAMGMHFTAPLGHLREYLRICKALLQTGRVDFDGTYYKAHETIAEPLDVPVMASALQKGSFELCGAEADGAISWICPGPYLRDVGLPAMRAGAQRASRAVPPLIAHAPVCVHDHPAEVRAAVREQIMNPRLPFYQRMLAAAGFPEAENGVWSDRMIDGVVFSGNEARVSERLSELFAWGATEILATPVLAGSDRAASLDRTMRLLGQVAQTVS